MLDTWFRFWENRFQIGNLIKKLKNQEIIIVKNQDIRVKNQEIRVKNQEIRVKIKRLE